jgi:hypothetical protein
MKKWIAMGLVTAALAGCATYGPGYGGYDGYQSYGGYPGYGYEPPGVYFGGTYGDRDFRNRDERRGEDGDRGGRSDRGDRGDRGRDGGGMRGERSSIPDHSHDGTEAGAGSAGRSGGQSYQQQ